MLDITQKYVLDTKQNVLQPQGSENQTPHQSLNTEDDVSYQQRQNSKRKLVLSNRGCLSNIMAIPYRLEANTYNDRTFFATRYCGVFHISDCRWRTDNSSTVKFHSKFQQTCFSDKLQDNPDMHPNTDVPVNDDAFISGIFHSTIKEFDLIYSGEIMGIVSKHKIDDMQNIENINKLRFINTKLFWKTRLPDIWKDPKCLLWWLQSYLANTADICAGLKESDGCIHSPIQLKPVKNLPKDQKWKPHICIRFLLTMLQLIEKSMSSVDCPYTVFEFVYDSYAKCIKLKKHIGKTEYSFLTEEYIERCRIQTSKTC
ncbi:uncharacterized protein [Bactrocera oleae]|uniref:uncharacterized protein n=1 Tax=Bactrocera oleae TaxID=104688 RepID=UPI00387EB3A3